MCTPLLFGFSSCMVQMFIALGFLLFTLTFAGCLFSSAMMLKQFKKMGKKLVLFTIEDIEELDPNYDAKKAEEGTDWQKIAKLFIFITVMLVLMMIVIYFSQTGG